MKKNTILLLMSLTAMFFFYSCNPEEETAVSFTIGDATNISYCSATFSVALTAKKVMVSDKGICFSSQNEMPTTDNSNISMGEETGTFSVTLTQLEENTNYYVRPYAIANEKIYYGEVKKFTTELNNEGLIINGIRWATRNLGIHGQFVDHPEDFGGYYQWGRKGDGHENPTSNITYTLSTTDNPPHGDFIVTDGYNTDWRTPPNDNLWGAIKTDNDPCPAGWRVPTKNEYLKLKDVINYWSELNGVYGRFFVSGGQKLFLPAAEYRGYWGTIGKGTVGLYWSSSIYDSGAYAIELQQNYILPEKYWYGFRADGLSVRCVAE